MRIIFFGTPNFAGRILDYILRETDHEIVAVVSRPDAPSGRGRVLQSTPVKKIALDFDPQIPILQPHKVSSPEVVTQLASYNADIFLVVAYGEILRKEVLAIPPKGCFNIHASLLPEYRGAAPIQRALMNGCKKTGITFMRMGEGMDSGDIVLQKACTVSENENAGELTEKLLKISLELVDAALYSIETNTAVFEQQQHDLATYAPKILPEDLVLNEVEDIWRIHDIVRGLSPIPGAYFWVLIRDEKKRLKILRTHIDETCSEKERRWKCTSDGFLSLSTAEGSLIFDEIQLEGKAAISSKDFLRGTPLDAIFFL